MDEKIKAVILTVLQESREPVHRTKLVKLIYLADNLFYEHFGKTITGLGYMWDNFGPNAISNAIVKEADELVDEDFVCIKVSPNIYGSESYLYSVGLNKTDMAEKVLEPIEKKFILDIVEQYKSYSVDDIVRVSKNTKPFGRAKQYQVLNMAKSSKYQDLLDKIRSDSKVMAGITEGMKKASEGMPLEKVKQQYGL